MFRAFACQSARSPHLKTALLGLVIFLAAARNAAATDYYVDEALDGGLDTNPGTSVLPLYD